MGLPDRQELIQNLLAFVEKRGIHPNPAFSARTSGVYAVLDTVYSSMAKFEAVVETTLARFGINSGLLDEPGLRFSDFMAQLDGAGGSAPPPKRLSVTPPR